MRVLAQGWCINLCQQLLTKVGRVSRRASGERRPRESPGDLSFSPDDNHSSISSRATLPETSGVSAGGRRESGERSTKLEHSCAKILTSPSGNHSAILS